MLAGVGRLDQQHKRARTNQEHQRQRNIQHLRFAVFVGAIFREALSSSIAGGVRGGEISVCSQPPAKLASGDVRSCQSPPDVHGSLAVGIGEAVPAPIDDFAILVGCRAALAGDF